MIREHFAFDQTVHLNESGKWVNIFTIMEDYLTCFVLYVIIILNVETVKCHLSAKCVYKKMKSGIF